MTLKRTMFVLPLALTGCKEPIVVESYLALVHISPSPGSGEINVNTQVVATFSEPLVSESVDAQTVWMEDINQVPVVAETSYDGSTSSIILTPETSLEVNTTYRVFLTSKIRGANSGKLRANITSDFTTGGWVPVNELPVADAGDDVGGDLGSRMQFDGSGSMDPEGASLTYTWRIVSRPPGSAPDLALNETNAIAVAFTPDAVGEYVIGLVVNDGTEDSSEDFALARIGPAAEPPIDTGSPDTGTPPPDTGGPDTGSVPPTPDTGGTTGSDTGT